MSRRTKNSLASLSEADIERFVLESLDADGVGNHSQTEKSNENTNQDSEIHGDELIERTSNVATRNEVEVNRKHSSCQECKSHKDELAEIKAIIAEIKSSQIKQCENAVLSAVESDAKIKYLHDENKVMAAEIELLKAT